MSLLRNRSSLFYGLVLAGWCSLASCQYQFGRGELSQQYATISIPYVEGDSKGELTAEVIKKLSFSGALRYVNHNGDLVLKIKLIEWSDENIDFRYDRKKRGEIKKSIIPTESRFTVLAEVLLIESVSGQTIRGPTLITAYTEFDHTYYTTRDEINVFSLGQLSDVDSARDVATHPLNRVLADRIVDYVINSW
jgi:hypothetical protein